MSPDAKTLMERAKCFAQALGHQKIGPGHVFLAYVAMLNPDELPDPRLTVEAVMSEFMTLINPGCSLVDITVVSLPRSLDAEVKKAIEQADRLVIRERRDIQPNDIIRFLLDFRGGDVTLIVTRITNINPNQFQQQLKVKV